MDPRGYCSSTQKVTTRKGEEEGGRTYTGDPRRLLGGKGTLPSPPPSLPASPLIHLLFARLLPAQPRKVTPWPHRIRTKMKTVKASPLPVKPSRAPSHTVLSSIHSFTHT